MEHKIKEFNLHITEFCSGHCPMCYATNEDMVRKHGDIETLKKIVHNAICYGNVDRFVMVGGDPCEHPNLVKLLKYIKKEGMKVIFHTDTRDYETYGSFKKISPKLPNNFVQCHKSYIVNTNKISEIQYNNNIVLFGSDNEKCYIGPKYKNNFMEVLKHGNFSNNLDCIDNA